MSMEGKLDKLAEESYRFHGEIREYVSTQKEKVAQISKKLDDHVEEIDAHGGKARRSLVGDWVLVLSAVVSLVSLALHFSKSESQSHAVLESHHRG